MASTPHGRALTEAHRARQVSVKSRMAADVAAAWSLLDPDDLDKTTPVWLAVMLAIVGLYRGESAEVSAAYFRAYRQAETGPDTLPDLDPGAHAQPDRDRVIASLMATGPAAIKAATAKKVAPAKVQRVALVRATGAAARHSLDGGRETLRAAIRDDPKALGWIRVTDVAPCGFCAMLASRGPVYRSKRAGLLGKDSDPYHDHCACTVEPVYSYSAAWPGNGREYQKLWKDSTKGKAGEKARNAFRIAVAERNARNGVAAPLRNTGRNQRNDRDTVAQPEPLSDATLAQLSDEDLSEAFAVASNRATVDDALLDRLLSEMDRRDGITPEPADPLDGIDLGTLLDGELFDLWEQHDASATAYDRIAAELDRRDHDRGNLADDILDPDTAPDDTEEAAETLALLDADLDAAQAQAQREKRIDALIARGYDYAEAYAEVYTIDPESLRRQEMAAAVDAQRQRGETRDQTARRLYDEWVNLAYLAAERDTNGFLLSAEGVSAGIDPRSLWGGTAARARKYASEELARWWQEHPRQTFVEFRAALLGRDRDLATAKLARTRGNGRDFGL